MAVAWDEAREVLVVVLLAAALLHVVAPMIRYAGIGHRSWWEDLYGAFANVNPLAGILLLGAAVAVCTTPAADMVPRLRRSVLLGRGHGDRARCPCGHQRPVCGRLLAMPAALRLAAVAWRPGPAVLLSGSAAWMARRVVLFG